MVGIENTRVGRPAQATNGVNGVNGTNGTNGVNGTNGTNGVNGHANGVSSRRPNPRNPYAPRASDFLNNVTNFKIIESTLRGEYHLHHELHCWLIIGSYRG